VVRGGMKRELSRQACGKRLKKSEGGRRRGEIAKKKVKA